MMGDLRGAGGGGGFDPFRHGDDWLDEDPSDPFVGHYTDSTGCHPIRASEMGGSCDPLDRVRAEWRRTPKVAYVDHRMTAGEADVLRAELGLGTTLVVFREPEAGGNPRALRPTVVMDARQVNAKNHRELSRRDERPPKFADASASVAASGGDVGAERYGAPVTEMLGVLGTVTVSRLTEVASGTASSAVDRAKGLKGLALGPASTVAERAKGLRDLASDAASSVAERAKGLRDLASDGASSAVEVAKALADRASGPASSAAERAVMVRRMAEELAARWLGADDSDHSEASEVSGADVAEADSSGRVGGRRATGSAAESKADQSAGGAGARRSGRSRWDGRLATSSDGRVNLHETIYQHLLREYGPDAPPEGRGRRRSRRSAREDGRERYVGTDREGIAPGLGYMRSFAAARGLDMDVDGQFVSYEDLEKGAPEMQMITTHVSSYGRKAAADPKLVRSPIALNLADIAPLLLGWVEGVSAEAVPGKRSRWGRTEIEQTLEREVRMLEGEFGPLGSGESPGEMRAKAAAWERVLDAGCADVPVPLVPDLIRSCDITSMAHDECGHAGGSEEHREGHRRMSASWRCLAAYLAARLDSVGRHMSPALMFERE